MHLWIDGQCLQTASRTRGIGRYVTELVRAIADHHPDIKLSMSFNASMADAALLARTAVSDVINPANIHIWHGAAGNGETVEGYTPERRLSELAIAHHVNCLAPDVALSASPFEGGLDRAVPLLPETGCNVPLASIFYDAIPFRYKRSYLTSSLQRDYYYRRLNAYRGFADNLCISAFSQAELESIHPAVRAANISAGVSKHFIEIETHAFERRSDLGDFVLYVGGLDWRKNVSAIVKAFGHIDQIWPRSGLKLVIAGDIDASLLSNVVGAWNGLSLNRDRLVCAGHVTDEELVSLYKQARVLVQPSFMEGFGLTALEAIYCGTPVVAARAGALPEVVDIDEWLFDPARPKDLADVIVRLLRNESGTAASLKKVQAHAEQFTWKRTAAIIVEHLAKLVQGKPAAGIAASRREIGQMLDVSTLDRDVAARSLALSEPVSSRPRLLIEATSTVLIDHKTGIQRVVKKTCAALAERAPSEAVKWEFVACDDSRGWFAVDGRTLDRPQKEQQAPLTLIGDTLLMLDSSAWAFHSLYQKDWRACRLRGGDVISCLYDTVPLHAAAMCHPGMPPVFAQWFQTALACSTAFVCISRAVADELLALLAAIEFPHRMKVGYWQLGADFTGKPASAPIEPDKAPRRPQFLMVGTLEPRKGHRVALDAFEKLWAEGIDVDLIIVGNIGWGITHLVERIRRHPEFGQRLVWHMQADDDKLGALYARCDALIAASFAEGFGLPIVEAGHFGKPVLASDIPVFREVAQGAAAARFFKVSDSAALAEAVREFLQSPRPNAASGRWSSWAESAAQLENVVLGGNWYKTYEPREHKPFSPTSDIGRIRMTGALVNDQRAHGLELIEGPYLTDDGRNLKIIVAMTNMSNTLWSSAGPQGERFGVALSYHLYDRDGAVLQYENPRVHIPFVHIPGDTIYLAVYVPLEWRARGAAFADCELVQEGAAWFGKALRVKL